MLKIIEGRAGSGKTRAVFEEIKNMAELSRKKIVLLVPEQFSALTERALVQYLGNCQAEGIEVLSFNRISDYIFKNLGGTAARRLSLAGRYIVMNKALDSVKDKLLIYKNSADYVQFIESLITVADEFAAYQITAEEVERSLSGIGQGMIYAKMHDLTLIFEAYNAILGQNLLDGAQNLEIATQRLENSTLFDGYTFFFDSFSGFTPNQLHFIDVLLPRLENAVFTLTGEGLAGNSYPSHFEVSAKTLSKLVMLAKRHSISYSVKSLEGSSNFSEGIAHLEKNLFRTKPDRAKTNQNVFAVRADGVDDEVSFAAGDILKKIRKEGYKFGDFAVICRNASDYDSAVSRIFAKYGVPVFVSVQEDFINTPLSMLVLSAIRCITSGFTYQSVFGYLKSSLSPLDDRAVCELENYAYTWNIRGSKWSPDREWTYHPDGYNRLHSDRTEKKLKRINENKIKATAEIFALKEKVKNKGAAAISRAIFEMLEALSVKEKLEAQSAALAKEGDFDGAAKTAQQWNVLLSCIDQLALLGGEEITLARYAELLKMALSAESIATIPNIEDAVTFGSADRIRTQGIRVCYILGMNEGVFPKNSFEQGIITDRERTRLLEAGIELAATSENKVEEERFLCYCALTAASESVTVSYSASGVGGVNTKPSFVYKSLFDMFCDLEEKRCSKEMEEIAESKDAAFEYLLLTKGGISTFGAALDKYFSTQNDYAKKRERILGSIDRQKRIKTLENKCNVDSLYSGKTLSPTRLDSFSGCQFRHFCRYGLDLHELQKMSFSAPEIGTFMHSIVERFFKNYGDSPRSSQGEIISTLIEEYVAENEREFADASERFKTSFNRLRRVLNTYIFNIREELATSDFKPIAFELNIGMGGNISPYKVGRYEISGKIDRVDGYKTDKGLYVRVVDYKTGSKEFAFEEIARGMNLQMLLYLFALCNEKNSEFGREILPAGVLYSQIKADAQKANRAKSEAELQKSARSQNIAKGILLEDEEILSAMDRSGEFSLLPVKFKNGKIDARSAKSLITAEQFDLLEKYVASNLEKTVASIENGDIRIAPVSSQAGSPCSFCPVKAVCGMDGAQAEELEKLDKDEFFEMAGGAQRGI